MKLNLAKLLVLFLLIALSISACGSAASSAANSATPTVVPVVAVDTEIVSEGRLVPNESVELSFFTSGQVAEILVEEGDPVKTGDVVARLGNRETLVSSISTAELELVNAQQALKDLTDNLPEEQTNTLQVLNDARDGLRDAEQRLNGFDVAREPLDIEVQRSNVAIAEKALKQAKEDYKPWEKKAKNSLRRAAALNRLRDAQERYDHAVEELNRLTGVTTPAFELEQAQTELLIAQERLKLAQEKHDLLKNGTDPDDVALVEARINAAQDAVTSAQAALVNLELKATIDGTIVKQDLVIGQNITAGQPVMTVADFSQLYAETDDLTEIEVVNVSENQKAVLIPDALPDVELTGTVESISQNFEEKRGDITYTARILLDEIDPRLRWGMTVEVTFEK
jgi:multidrug efflux pump subunit AcrA (membrane-fusion protein)